jgi:prophage antirepressor-like protein
MNQIFTYAENIESHVKIRAIGTHQSPLFPATDVCQALGIANTSKALENIDPDDLTFGEVIDALGRPQVTNCLTESGLYTLILRSNKPNAEAFRRWVTKEVLPSIRKTGQYAQQSKEKLWEAYAIAKSGTVQLAILNSLGVVVPTSVLSVPSKEALRKPPPRDTAPAIDTWQFWRDVESALAAGQLSPENFRCKPHIEGRGPLLKEGYVLYLIPELVIGALKKHYQIYQLVQRQDFREALQTQPEWQPGKHKARFANGPALHAWVFKVLTDAPEAMISVCASLKRKHETTRYLPQSRLRRRGSSYCGNSSGDARAQGLSQSPDN